MISAEKIIVALDFSDRESTVTLFPKIEGHRVWVKIGMELFYGAGPELVHEARDRGFKIFLDLKLHDIPNTVAQAMTVLSRLPIDMVNVHASGGYDMMKRAAEVLKSTSRPPLLIAVTQLTSTTTELMNREQRIPGDVSESVIHYATLAKAAGCDGVVSSPLEVPAIKLTCGEKFITVTPGIRPLSCDSQDQKRITTPAEAIRLGTDFMVIGRPITQAAEPRQALEAILKGS
jgi:orotidine-5'-phosphate decarboxylase